MARSSHARGGSGSGYDHNSATGTAARDQTFTLDAVGNWTNLSTNGTGSSRTVNAQNQYTAIGGSTTPNYDNNGNTILSDTNKTFVYDAWNRIVKVKSGTTTQETLAYMPGDLGSATNNSTGVTTTSYYSINGQVVEDDAPCGGCCGGATTATYVWGSDFVDDLIERDSTNLGASRLYVQTDANWDVTSLVSSGSTPAVQERFEYDPYGTRTVLNATWGSASDSQTWIYGFQGGRLDTISGLIHFKARDLSTTMGRWMQQDPAGYVDGENMYSSFGSNPVVYADPSGTTIIQMDETAIYQESATEGGEAVENPGFMTRWIQETSVTKRRYGARFWVAGGQTATGADGSQYFSADPQAYADEKNVQIVGSDKTSFSMANESIKQAMADGRHSKDPHAFCTQLLVYTLQLKRVPEANATAWVQLGNIQIGSGGWSIGLPIPIVPGGAVGLTYPWDAPAAWQSALRPTNGEFYLSIMVAANGSRAVFGGKFEHFTEYGTTDGGIWSDDYNWRKHADTRVSSDIGPTSRDQDFYQAFG